MSPIVRASLLIVMLQVVAVGAAWADLHLPVNGPITSGVGWRLDPFGSGRMIYHRGIDIAVPTGTPVSATRAGRVIQAGTHGGHGLTVIIAHADGGKTLYGHNSAIAVKLNEAVTAGEVIAFSGNSGHSTGPHVHYEVLNDGAVPVQTAVAEEKPQSRKPDYEFRRQAELKIDETMDSILKSITRRPGADQGGD